LVLQQTVNMRICEQTTELGGYSFREIRRMGETGHQTSIITTHPTLKTASIAGRMFGRWCQENFFRYLIEDYDFDKMITFGTEEIDPEKTVVNLQYRKLTYQIKKLHEKIQRLEARFYPLVQQVMEEPIEKIPEITNKTLTVTLHTLSANRFNKAAFELTKLLNDCETIFPGTDLKMIFKISALSSCEG